MFTILKSDIFYYIDSHNTKTFCENELIEECKTETGIV